MSVKLEGGVIGLVGAGRVEDAEALVALLQGGAASTVDLTRAGPLHTALVQALLAFRPSLAGPPGDPFTAAWLIAPLTGMANGAGSIDMADIAANPPTPPEPT